MCSLKYSGGWPLKRQILLLPAAGPGGLTAPHLGPKRPLQTSGAGPVARRDNCVWHAAFPSRSWTSGAGSPRDSSGLSPAESNAQHGWPMAPSLGLLRAVRDRLSGSPGSFGAHVCVCPLPGPGVPAHSAGLGCSFTCPVALLWKGRMLWLIDLSESQQFKLLFCFCFGLIMTPTTTKKRKGIWYCRRWYVVSLIVWFLSFFFFFFLQWVLWINNSESLSHRRHMCYPWYVLNYLDLFLSLEFTYTQFKGCLFSLQK